MASIVAEENRIVNYIKQSWLVLVLAVGLGSSLAAVDRSLQPRIAANAAARLRKAIIEVVPTGDKISEQQIESHTVFRVTDDDGNPAGWAVPAETMGFVDKIRLIVGVSADGQSITGLIVLDSRETPGLGENIRREEFRAQFAGLPTSATIEVVKPGQTAEHSIDALTGATISSRAVTKAANQAMQDVCEGLVGSPSATSEELPDE